MHQGRTAQPRVRPHIIPRPRLMRQLDEAAPELLIVVAPAGYGKTTLATQRLTATEHLAAWCHLTSASLDVAVLARAVAAACSDVVPSAGSVLAERLRAARKAAPEPGVLAETLAKDL